MSVFGQKRFGNLLATKPLAIKAGFFIVGALKNQVQHFSERMLHGKNLQSIEY
jgi:hypothetical protein